MHSSSPSFQSPIAPPQIPTGSSLHSAPDHNPFEPNGVFSYSHFEHEKDRFVLNNTPDSFRTNEWSKLIPIGGHRVPYHLEYDTEEPLRYESRAARFADGQDSRQGGHGSVRRGTIQGSRSVHPSCDGIHAHRSLAVRGIPQPSIPLHSSSFSLLSDVNWFGEQNNGNENNCVKFDPMDPNGQTTPFNLTVQPLPKGQETTYTPTHVTRQELVTMVGETALKSVLAQRGKDKKDPENDNVEQLRGGIKRSRRDDNGDNDIKKQKGNKANSQQTEQNNSDIEDEDEDDADFLTHDPYDIVKISQINDPQYDLPSPHVFLHHDFELFYHTNIETLFTHTIEVSAPPTTKNKAPKQQLLPQTVIDPYRSLITFEHSTTPDRLSKGGANPQSGFNGKFSMFLSEEDQKLLQNHVFIEKTHTLQQAQRILDRAGANSSGVAYKEFVNSNPQLGTDEDGIQMEGTSNNTIDEEKLVENVAKSLTILVDYPLRLRQLDAYAFIDDETLPQSTTTLISINNNNDIQTELQALKQNSSPSTVIPPSSVIKSLQSRLPKPPIPSLMLLWPPHFASPPHHTSINLFQKNSCYTSPYSLLYPYFHNHGTRGEPIAIKTALPNDHFVGLSFDHVREMIYLQHLSSSYKVDSCTNCVNKWLQLQNPMFVHETLKSNKITQLGLAKTSRTTSPTQPSQYTTTQIPFDIIQRDDELSMAEQAGMALPFTNRVCLCAFHSISHGYELGRWELNRHLRLLNNRFKQSAQNKNDLNRNDQSFLHLHSPPSPSKNSTNPQFDLTDNHLVPFKISADDPECNNVTYLSTNKEIAARLVRSTLEESAERNALLNQSYQSHSIPLGSRFNHQNAIYSGFDKTHKQLRINFGMIKANEVGNSNNGNLPNNVSENSNFSGHLNQPSKISVPLHYSPSPLFQTSPLPLDSPSPWTFHDITDTPKDILNQIESFSQQDQIEYAKLFLQYHSDNMLYFLRQNEQFYKDNMWEGTSVRHKFTVSHLKESTKGLTLGCLYLQNLFFQQNNNNNNINIQTQSNSEPPSEDYFHHNNDYFRYIITGEKGSRPIVNESNNVENFSPVLENNPHSSTIHHTFSKLIHHLLYAFQSPPKLSNYNNSNMNVPHIPLETTPKQPISLTQFLIDIQNQNNTPSNWSSVFNIYLKHLIPTKLTNSVIKPPNDQVSFNSIDSQTPRFTTSLTTLSKIFANHALSQTLRYPSLTIAPTNILSTTLYDTSTDGELMTVMEFMKSTLQDIIHSSYPHFSQYHIKRIFWMVCQSLAQFHRRFFLHRDIKPANVLVKLPTQPLTNRLELHRRINSNQQEVNLHQTPPPLPSQFSTRADEFYTYAHDPTAAPSLIRKPFDANQDVLIQTYQDELEQPFQHLITRPYQQLQQSMGRNPGAGNNSNNTRGLTTTARLHQQKLFAQKQQNYPPPLADYELSTLLCSLADFGGTRDFGSLDKILSPQAYTSWYRPPELLMLSKHYSYSADIWAMGCILGELMLGKPLFDVRDQAGQENLRQLKLIFTILGPPSLDDWPTMHCLPGHPRNLRELYGTAYHKGAADDDDDDNDDLYLRNVIDLSNSDKNSNPLMKSIGLDRVFERAALNSPEGFSLLKAMLQWNPNSRPNIEQVLQHPFFDEVRQ